MPPQVLDAETKFKQAQELRMKQQQEMLNIQKSLREIHAELDKTARGEDRYLQLITKVMTTRNFVRLPPTKWSCSSVMMFKFIEIT